MESIKLLCPFTKLIINKNNQITSYLRWTSKNKKIDINQLRFLVYYETFGEIVSKCKFSEYYEEKKYSLPMFLKEFHLKYNVTQFLIKFHNCKKRTLKEATKLGAIKTKETNLKKYGVEQTFQVPEFAEKRKATYFKKYGVDNPFKLKNFMEKVEKTFIEKYGITRKEYYTKKSKEVWENKTEEEQQKWINSCFQSISSLEKTVWRILGEFNIPFQTQKKIKRFIFDVFLPDINILIEVNGTIFHADPDKYKEDDVMPLTGRVAKDIWLKDIEKRRAATELGYTTIIIWEKEIVNKSDIEIFDTLCKKIEDYRSIKDK